MSGLVAPFSSIQTQAEHHQKMTCILRDPVQAAYGDTDFKFLARDTVPPYVDNRPMLVAGKPELREYKAVYVVSDAEIGLFSDEVVVNCAP